ncbi:MAG TPA: alkaline phosphatase family protein, partial [Acidimicrobiia bacterium]|nr:alkaline phosphatase family protein [Acidimicrobiia bacterium]
MELDIIPSGSPSPHVRCREEGDRLEAVKASSSVGRVRPLVTTVRVIRRMANTTMMRIEGPVRRRLRCSIGGAVVALVVAAGCGDSGKHSTQGLTVPTTSSANASTAPTTDRMSAAIAAALAIHKIRHVVVIMQENRSFDSYFGTYPGADGIPMRNGVPDVCVPDPVQKACIRPFPDHADVNVGGPHAEGSARVDI